MKYGARASRPHHKQLNARAARFLVWIKRRLRTCSINPGLFLPKVKIKQSIHSSVSMNFDYYDISEYSSGADTSCGIELCFDSCGGTLLDGELAVLGEPV